MKKSLFIAIVFTAFVGCQKPVGPAPEQPTAAAPAAVCEVAQSVPDTCRACAQQSCCGPMAGWEPEKSARGLGCLRGCVKTSPTPETRAACDSNCSNLFPNGIAGARAAYACLQQSCAEACAQ